MSFIQKKPWGKLNQPTLASLSSLQKCHFPSSVVVYPLHDKGAYKLVVDQLIRPISSILS